MPPALEIDGPAVAFGGPYSNLEATRALLEAVRRRGIPPQRILCTGDVVAYCADPVATIDLVRTAGLIVVQGNCEASLADDASDCGCGFVPGSTCDSLSRRWFAFASNAVSDDDRAWMAALPRRVDINIAGRRLAVVHATLESNNRFVFASTPAAEKLSNCARAGADGIIAGHCGLPFTQVIEGRLWHNPGVIGLPANDGTPSVWYSLLTPERDRLRVEHLPLDYDHHSAACRMRQAGLPEGYARALEPGLWPSCDVLPSPERKGTGAPILETKIRWKAPRDALSAA